MDTGAFQTAEGSPIGSPVGSPRCEHRHAELNGALQAEVLRREQQEAHAREMARRQAENVLRALAPPRLTPERSDPMIPERGIVDS